MNELLKRVGLAGSNARNGVVVGDCPIVGESVPELHDAHVTAEFSHWLENLPFATWAPDAPKLPAPPKTKSTPKGSKLLLALIKRATFKPNPWPFDVDYDF
jgi:hypothetical protein